MRRNSGLTWRLLASEEQESITGQANCYAYKLPRNFESLDSQRSIASRLADRLVLRTFLGYGIREENRVHHLMTILRERLPESAFDEVFTIVLALMGKQGQTMGIDSTTLAANAAMMKTGVKIGAPIRAAWSEPRGLRI